MPFIEARNIKRIVMRNHSLRGAEQMMLERRIVSPQDAAAASTTHRGRHGSTPIVGSCYFSETRTEKNGRRGKAALLYAACLQRTFSIKDNVQYL